MPALSGRSFNPAQTGITSRDPAANENTPLLTSNKRLTPPPPSTPTTYDILVCVLVFSISSLFVFSPLRRIFGTSVSKHTVATTAVWFHPVRTRGNFIEVLYYTFTLLLFACAIIFASAHTVSFITKYSDLFDVRFAVLMSYLGLFCGVVGYNKVRIDNASFNTATTAASIFSSLVLIREEGTQFGDLPWRQVVTYLLMVVIGALISSFVCFFVYRKSAFDEIQRTGDLLAQAYTQMLSELVTNFGTKPFSNPDAVIDANAALTTLKQDLKYARYECAIFKLSTSHPKYLRAKLRIESLQRLSMHLGGMVHCSNNIARLNIANHSFIGELRGQMCALASQLTSYINKDFVLAPTPEEMRVVLQKYIENRDKVLSNFFALCQTCPNSRAASPTSSTSSGQHFDSLKSTPLNRACLSDSTDSLQAMCTLFAYLLEEFTKQVLSPKQSLDKVKGQQTKHSFDEQFHFQRLHDIMHPTLKPDIGHLGPKLWKFMRIFRNRDVRHGIRVGLGAVILCSPAFLAKYRPVFQRWHGEWAIITYMIIMNRNLGAVTDVIFCRVTGTTVGAIVGVVVSTICQNNQIALYLASCLVAGCCYRGILGTYRPAFGRFALLSYNLVCLYGFTIAKDIQEGTDKPNLLPMYDVALRRVVSVLVGVLWSVFIIVTVWPHSARQALRTNLCIQWMRMGMTWKNDMLGIEYYPTRNGRAKRFKGLHTERELQNMMLRLDTLLKNSPNEFRLRGKFDPGPYKQLLESTQLILDAFHSVSILIDEEPEMNPNEQNLVTVTGPERQELCNLLFLQFYTASTSVRLGFPVPEYLPEPFQPMNRLIDKLKDHRLMLYTAGQSHVVDQYDFVLFYSYLMVAITVAAELQRIHVALRALYGTLDDDALFAYV